MDGAPSTLGEAEAAPSEKGGGKPDMPQIFIAPWEVAFWCEGTWGHPKDAQTPLYSGGVTFAVGRGRKVPRCGQPNCDPSQFGFCSK